MIYIDSANLNDMRDAVNYPFIAGFTTNPKLIAKEIGKNRIPSCEFMSYVEQLSAAVEGDLFVQTNHADAPGITAEAIGIHRITGEKGIIKIPLTLPGLQAMKKLTRQGIRCAATAVYTGIQAHLAMLSGAEFVIPYYNRLEWTLRDNMQLIRDILAIINNGVFDTQLLVASVKTPLQVLQLLREGVHGITIPMELVGELVISPETQDAVGEFSRALEIVNPNG